MLAFERWIFLPAITTEFLYIGNNFFNGSPALLFQISSIPGPVFLSGFQIFKINARSSGHTGQGVFGMGYF